jgi:glycosyltransferase involved in cell wall biosynthesis
VKLAILTQYYPPEIGAPQARLSAIAEGMARRGHAVTVLAAKPNYPVGRVRPGYPGLVAREEGDGVTVLRTLIYPTQRADLLHRLACYFSFVASSAVAGTLLLKRPDYLLVESPPLFLGLAGLWLSWSQSARLIFNVSDLWPESAVRLGVIQPGSAGHRWSELVESACYRRAWLVTGQTSAIVTDIQERFPRVRTHHLSNGVDTAKFRPDAGSPSPSSCRVLYAGLLGLAQGLDQLIDAAIALRHEPDLEFVLAGEGPCRAALIERVAAQGLERVRFLDPRPHADMPALLASADIIVVPLHRSFGDAVPSKLFEALASGRPIVLVASGEAARIVHEADAGIVVSPDDALALVSALRRLAADPALRARLGANGRAAAAERFDRHRIVDAFAALLEAGEHPAGAAAIRVADPQRYSPNGARRSHNGSGSS